MRATLMVALLVALPGLVVPASADPALCQRTIVKYTTAFKKKKLKALSKCLDKVNIGTLPGPCPDNATSLRIASVRDKMLGKIELACPTSDAAAIGYGSCNFGIPGEDSVKESQCRQIPADQTAGAVAACINCWTEADLDEFLAIVYASHAVQVCDTLGLSSQICSMGGCASQLGTTPDQRNLGDTGENDCQRGIANAGIKYLLSREKALEKCALSGGTRASCLANPAIAGIISKADTKKTTVIHDKCGNRDPQPNLPFCCKTMGNQCMAAADRDACETGGGTVQEGKTCGVGNTCDPLTGGGQKITWWDVCARRQCGNYGVTTLDDLIQCVGDRADEIVDGTLCYQFPRNGHSDWPCPSSPSAAFLD